MNNQESFKKVKKALIFIMKLILGVIIKIFMPIIIIVVLLTAMVYFITVDDGTYKEDDWSSVPFVSGGYNSSVTIGTNGEITSAETAQEIWDKNIKEGGRVDKYLDNADQLQKLMNAEAVTQYLDTRKDPDSDIDWDSINNSESKNIQGIVKLKRADTNGDKTTMTYADPETFQAYIDKYNNSGSESDRKKALSHFTLDMSVLSSYGQAKTIEAGTSIKIPSSLGSTHSYMGWQKITSVTSTQYKLREQAGMNFDEEGFGRINGRYVIACTTTYGKVGDYIDFYQEDGTVIQCIIGDIKSRGDKGCTKWGHNNGHCIVEFIVDKGTWYKNEKGDHVNPGTSTCHPEWNKNIIKAVNGGSYFDNPNFGENDSIQETKQDDNISNDEEIMTWPTDGTNITSEYGSRESPTANASSNHKGIDIGIAEGTNVYACESGKVTIATDSETAGKYIAIDHGNGYISKYMHNSELKVKVGDKVKKGDIIALSGNTGTSTGEHLHFQIEYNGNPIDPMTFKYITTDGNEVGDGTGGVGSDSNGMDSIAQYYAKVAIWNEETNKVEAENDPDIESTSNTTYSMTTSNINYQQLISGYTMPFDYLWALLVVGEDKDFVLKLADLVYGSDIEITVHDSLTVNTNVKEDTYTKKKKTDTKGKVTISYGIDGSVQNIEHTGNWSDEETIDCKKTETVITKTNTVDVALTRANVWIVDYKQKYGHSKPESTTNITSEKLEDKDYSNKPNITKNGDTYGHVKALLEEKKNIETGETYDFIEGSINFQEEDIYNATVNRNTKITNTVETTKYISSPSKIEEKTNKNSQEDNFVTLFIKSTKAKSNILSAKSWLYEILEINPSTKDTMVDLTKYLLYKVTSKDYGKTEFDFKLFDPSNFKSISDDLNGSITGDRSIVNVAKIIHDYMAQNSYTYCVYGGNGNEECSGEPHGLNKTFEQSKTGYHHSCCATFVSWVLQECGYLNNSEHLDGANTLQELLKRKGFKVINSKSELEPGDILCYDHHVEIYVGDNTLYNAGSGRSIRALKPTRVYRAFNYALRAPNKK